MPLHAPLRIRIALTFRIVLLIITAAPAIASEIAVSDPQIVAALREQYSAGIASDGEEYFAAWVDNRSVDAGERLYGARITADGVMRDPLGVPLSEIAPGVEGPAVVWTGHEYVVFWVSGFSRVLARRISPTGQLIDPRPVLIEDNFQFEAPVAVTNGQTILLQTAKSSLLLSRELQIIRPLDFPTRPEALEVMVATGGEDYLAAAIEYVDGVVRLVLLRIGDDGAIARIYSAPRDQSRRNLQLAWTGRDYVLVSFEHTAGLLRVEHLDRNGRFIGEPWATLETPSPSHVSVAGRGDGTALIWYEVSTRGFSEPADVFTARITSNSIEPPVALGTSSSPHGAPLKLASNGNTFIGTLAMDGLEFVLLNADGKRNDVPSHQEETRSATAQFDLAADPQRPAEMLVWVERDNTSSRIMVRPIDPEFPFGPPIRVSSTSNRQYAPAIAGNGQSHLVVWLELPVEFGFIAEVKAIRFSETGQPLDPEPLLLGTTTLFRDPLTQLLNDNAPPAVIWDGAAYIVAFPTEERRMVFAAIDESGFPLGLLREVPDTRMQPQSKPALARAGDVTFLAWQEGENEVQCVVTCTHYLPGNIVGIRLASGGQPLDTEPIQISDGLPYEVQPDVSSDGILFFTFTWMHRSSVRARRFGVNGRAVDPTSFAVGEGWPYTEPDIAFDGTRFAITWEGGSKYYEQYMFDIRAAHVNRDGSTSSVFSVAGPERAHRNPIAFRTLRNKVAIGWEHFRSSQVTDGVSRIVYRTDWTDVESQSVRRRTASR
jgi:hypothetical protein